MRDEMTKMRKMANVENNQNTIR